MYYHRVWADIDLDAAAFNLEQIRTYLPGGTEIMVVVKADAYGHGAVTIARHLEHRRIWGFGVGDSNEALELRAAGISCPILILGAIIEDEIERVIKNGVSVCIHSMDRVERLSQAAQRLGRQCLVHLMVDTGMGRLGVFPDRAVLMARKIIDFAGLRLGGVVTHYSSTMDPEDPFIEIQTKRFLRVKEELEEAGIRPEYFHAANSGALFSPSGGLFNLVRPGIALYGISSSKVFGRQRPLKPVLSLKTQIIYMKDVPENTPIGYERLYSTDKPTRIATLPIGYNDGFPYRLSNQGRVLVHGESAPVVGAVSMDYTMIDVGPIPGAAVGDKVTIIGEDRGERVTVEELAGAAGTIPYEITCRIGKRVRRIARRQVEDASSRSGERKGKEPSRDGMRARQMEMQ